uniref:Ig-like domain-containing protein n=1 Tax=Sphaeramia orbicularis TaxID=375764 RepID=A0A673CA23_9TELE
MGTSAVDAFLLTIGDDVSFVHQEERFVFVKAGDDLSLQCSYEPDVGTRFYWYKQILGQKLRLISSFYKYNSDYTFYGEFNNNPRFKLDTENHKNHLNISDLHISDSGTYYCASSFAYNFDIGEGTTVSVEESLVLVYFLSGALGFTTILIVLLSFSVYKMKSKNNIQFSESQSRYPANTEVSSAADSLHYAALNIRAPNASRRQTNATDTDCVYSSMKK